MASNKIYSRAREQRFLKEEREKRKLTYETMQAETGLAPATLARLLKREPIDRIEGQTMTTLCEYFKCTVGDLLEYVPEKEGDE